jgi:hypothetical protein
MAISDTITKGNIWTGIAIGAGLLAAPIVIPAVASAARPLLKAVIKGGYLLYEYGREMVAEVTELTEDLFVEAKAEFEAGVTEVQEEQGERPRIQQEQAEPMRRQHQQREESQKQQDLKQQQTPHQQQLQVPPQEQQTENVKGKAQKNNEGAKSSGEKAQEKTKEPLPSDKKN